MSASRGGAGTEAGTGLLTVDQLATTTGLTVRTTRYYASLGLLPPPVRRGRVALYGPTHRARLELIRALQEHGFTLAAIERYLSAVPLDATPEELSVQQALLTSWHPGPWESLPLDEVDERAGRALTSADLSWLVRAGAVRRPGPSSDHSPEDVEVHPLLRLAVELRDLGMPLAGITEADAAVRRHMSQLADELTDVLRTHVLSRYRRSDLSAADVESFEQTWRNLRMLTLDAIVDAFQAAANELAARSLRAGTLDAPADGG
jgi:DNA-binding transcriptional MerR regulator